MAEAAPRALEEPLPEISLVVPVFNEEATLDEVCRRATATLEELGKPFEVIVVDDGSSDGTWAGVERLVAADPRVRAVRFKRNFGQHPAMHAGLVRARGDVVVTMDADLQNVPEDLPRLIAAVEGGADVASGRRVGREDSWGRTLPSKLINGMLRRFTGVEVSDFGCAFNAYSRSALEPVLGVIGKQKFTKALVLSAGASVVEVDLTHQARADSSRYSPFRLIRLALHVLAGFWPQPIQWAGVLIGSICGLLDPRRRHLGDRLLGRPGRLPGPPLPGRPRARRARGAGLHPGPGRRVPGADPARRRGTAALHDRRGARRAVVGETLLLPPRELVPKPDADDPVDYYYKPLTARLYRARLELAVDLLGVGRYPSLLEVGFGSGIFLPELAGHTDRLVAVDIHPESAQVEEMLRRLAVEAELRRRRSSSSRSRTAPSTGLSA